MARRSYLQRIAEPVRPGDPLLFAMPHAALDEARPPAVPQVAATTATPSSAPVLRRALARGVPPLAPAARPATPSAQVLAMTPVSAAAGGLPNAALPPASAPVVPAQPPSPQLAVEPGIRGAPVQAAHLPPAPGARHEEATAADFVGPPSSATAPAASAPAASAPAAGELSLAFHPAPLAAESTSDGVSTARSVVGHAEPAMRPPASLAAPLSNSSPAAAPPRIHIGTVEVRSAAPAPSHATPRSETAPISRAYAWRFGLVQG